MGEFNLNYNKNKYNKKVYIPPTLTNMVTENPYKEEDNVNHPPHYTWLKDKCGIEPVEMLQHMSFNIGNAMKYLIRHGKKESIFKSDKEKAIEDLKKSIFYINQEIKKIGGE